MPGANFPVQPVHTGRNGSLCLLHSLMSAWTCVVFFGRMTAANSVAWYEGMMTGSLQMYSGPTTSSNAE